MVRGDPSIYFENLAGGFGLLSLPLVDEQLLDISPLHAALGILQQRSAESILEWLAREQGEVPRHAVQVWVTRIAQYFSG